MKHLRLTALLLSSIVTVGCAGAPGGRRATTPDDVEPLPISEEQLSEARRGYWGMSFDDPERPALRAGLLVALDRHTPALIESGDYDAVVAHLADMTELLTPEDLGGGRVPSLFDPLARYVLREASRRGDEGRALAALLLLGAVAPDEADRHLEAYRALALWGREARSTLPDALDRYSSHIEVWEEHAELTPAPQVLRTLAQLHVERRDAVLAATRERGGGMRPRSSVLAQQLMRIAPLDVAAVYLRHGDLEGAIRHVRAMGATADTAMQLLEYLEEARASGERGASALAELAEAYRSARPAVAEGLGRLGLRLHPGDSRFPACLARVAAEAEDFVDATAWYARAIAAAPGERELYDEALEQLDAFIERGVFSDDPAEARALAAHAQRILEERLRRWPNSAPPLSAHELEYLMGMLEMNAGNAVDAQRHFEASVAVEENPMALLQLGLLLERLGRADEAAERYRRALDITPVRDRSDELVRAELLEHLGDAFAASGDQEQSERMYRQALDLWSAAASALEGAPLALLHVRRGVLLDRLGRHPEARSAFEAAIVAAPQWRETYATILSHLVASTPDPELALRVFRRAQRQITLEPEWRVYFALWVSGIYGRAGRPVDTDVGQVLRHMGSSSAWSGALARFGTGELAYDGLLRTSEGVGQRAEAHFYEGMRLLAGHDEAGARARFEEVLSTRMVSFYEFAMAQALLRLLPAPPDPTPSAAVSGD